MEAVHAVPTVDESERPPAATVTAARMFKYSEYLDVGEGAAQCEHSRDGECSDVEHFHAWCRLPNPYQQADIRSKGMAAKARRIRALKDPDSDESVVLDQALSALNDAAFTDLLIDELVGHEWAADYLEAIRDVEEDETFAHIEQDREEFARLGRSQGDLDEADQSSEYKRLATHMADYAKALNARLEAIQEPKKEALRERPFGALMTLARDKRVEQEADRAFADTYNPWMWFVGTMRVKRHDTLGRPYVAMWSEIGQRDRPAAGTMYGEAPEVIEALEATFTGLGMALQQASAGN